jgi:hypothetical protein
MKEHNYSSKGIHIKKINNNTVITKNNYKIQKEMLMKLPYFKDISLFEEFVFNENKTYNFTKSYIVSSQKNNPINKILEEEEDSPFMISIVFPEKNREMFFEQFNANKKE